MPQQLGSSGFPGQIDPATDELYLRPVRLQPDPVTVSHPLRPEVEQDPNREYGTARSFGMGDERGEVVVPQIVNGLLLPGRDAGRYAQQTGRNFGRFDTVEHADQAAQRIHELQQTHQELLQAGRNRHDTMSDQMLYEMLTQMMKGR